MADQDRSDQDGSDQDGSDQDGSGRDEPQQIALMRRMVEMSAERSRLAVQRTEMSAERSFMNAERTLSVWIRTALAVMVVGIAVDRFGLFMLDHPGPSAASDTASAWMGAALVALGITMAAASGARFRRYAATYRLSHALPSHHGPHMAPAFAALVVLFGLALLVLLLVGPDRA